MSEKSTSHRLIVNIVLFTINTFGSRLIVFFLIPLYTHYLTDSQLGLADLVSSTATIMMSIFSLRISSAVLRFAGKSKDKDIVIISSALKVIIYSSLGVFAFTCMGIQFFSIDKIFYYVPILYFVIGIKDVFAQYCKACGEVKIYALEGITSSFSHLLAAIVFLGLYGLNTVGYLFSILLANIIGLCILILFGKIHVSFVSITQPITSEMLAYSLPLVPNSLSWRFIELSDRYMVAWFISSAANGIYTISYKIPAMLGTLADIFIQAWLLTAIDEYDGDKDYSSFERIYATFEALLVLSSSIIILFNRIIAGVFYGSGFQTAAFYSPLLIFGLLFNNLQAFFASLYNAAKENKKLLYSSISAAIANIILNLILIPIIGVYGAIIATCVSYLMIAVIRIIGSRKLVQFYINYKLLIVNCSILLMQAMFETFVPNNAIRYSCNIISFLMLFLINFKRVQSLFGLLKKVIETKFCRGKA